jgi:hypothetical protein
VKTEEGVILAELVVMPVLYSMMPMLNLMVIEVLVLLLMMIFHCLVDRVIEYEFCCFLEGCCHCSIVLSQRLRQPHQVWEGHYHRLNLSVGCRVDPTSFNSKEKRSGGLGRRKKGVFTLLNLSLLSISVQYSEWYSRWDACSAPPLLLRDCIAGPRPHQK